jgi:hypothetical protein
MLVQPQQAATVCALDLVQHAIRSCKRAQTLDPKTTTGELPMNPLNLTLDCERAHVSGRLHDLKPVLLSGTASEVSLSTRSRAAARPSQINSPPLQRFPGFW